MKLLDIFPLGNSWLADATCFVAGVECEIEDVKAHPKEALALQLFKADKDGSLRGKADKDCGYEYISKPMPGPQLIEAFALLHQDLKFLENGDPFSHRTSTHVHVNCQSLETGHIISIMKLYALFEEFFFMMVKSNRRDNIHCVPLTETPLPAMYGSTLEKLVVNWHKYTAFNMKPLRELGTIEFRHLHGTGDVQEFTQWLGVLERLWVLGQEVKISKNALGQPNVILGWFDQIFSPVPMIMKFRPCVHEIIGNNLIDIKLSMVI